MFTTTIVKRVCISLLALLLACVAWAGEPDYYQIDLLVYLQPRSDVFGSIQVGKYKNLVHSAVPASNLSPNIQPSAQLSSAMQEAVTKLESELISYQWRSWIVRFDGREKHQLPIDLNLSPRFDTKASIPATDYTTLLGTLTLHNQIYLDLNCKFSVEQYAQSHLKNFDYAQYTRHLKMNKTQYLDNALVGMLIRVSRSSADEMAASAAARVDRTEDDESEHINPNTIDINATTGTEPVVRPVSADAHGANNDVLVHSEQTQHDYSVEAIQQRLHDTLPAEDHLSH